VIPSADEILAGYPFAARRWKLVGEPSGLAILAAVEDATTLAASDPYSEPAALFFAFARRPRAFPGAWRTMPALLALNQARSIGCRLRTDSRELNTLLVRIASRELGFDEVQAFFAERLEGAPEREP
jgi:hypothetical protein